ncbi:hypothetical protein ACFLYD_06680 [Chloroflexota bacterium]
MAEGDRVQIRVEGWIGERWTGWFDGMAIVYEGEEDDAPVTLLTGPVVDQAALRGLLTKIWDLNLSLISMTQSKVKGVGANE